MRNSKCKLLLFVLSMIVILVGCSNSNVDLNKQVSVTPSKLFVGEASKLQPHFDMVTGCVEVTYKGEKEEIGVLIELWEDGELIEVLNGAFRFIEENNFNGEVSFSLQDIGLKNNENPQEMILKTVISEENGYVASSIPMERFDEDCSYGPVEMYESIETNDTEDIIIGGVTAHKGSVITSGESIETVVETADWGLLLKLRFQ